MKNKNITFREDFDAEKCRVDKREPEILGTGIREYYCDLEEYMWRGN